MLLVILMQRDFILIYVEQDQLGTCILRCILCRYRVRSASTTLECLTLLVQNVVHTPPALIVSDSVVCSKTLPHLLAISSAHTFVMQQCASIAIEQCMTLHLACSKQ
jgi:hypothetical protein